MQIERISVASGDSAQAVALNPLKFKTSATEPEPSVQASSVKATSDQKPDSQANQTEQKLKAEKEVLQRKLDQANEQLKLNMSSIRFKTDDVTGRPVVTIYDMTTDEVIRQLPSEDALSNAQKITEFLNQSKTLRNDLTGMIFDDKA